MQQKLQPVKTTCLQSKSGMPRRASCLTRSNTFILFGAWHGRRTERNLSPVQIQLEYMTQPLGRRSPISAVTHSWSQNNRLLCASGDKTVRLWNLDTNLPVGPLLQHEDYVQCAALSADGKLLVTGCQNKNAYTWDIHAILKRAGLEDLLRPSSDVTAADATQAVDDELLPDFFNDATDGPNSSRTYGNYYRSSSRRPRPLASSFGSVNTLFATLKASLIVSRASYLQSGCSQGQRGYIYCSPAARKNTAANPIARSGIIHDTACFRY
ncbi:uncharacterized protein F5891DRAFT_488688 [Suillus fuscotomentosus]|uniref:WD_REPEATS_REGION domain-containing protein n=1 Tax=Suillus fuscotomentosus TaxID=1912939 RepID=A0AAD4E1S3_9AGAM|nr:uncharacterized protein F5891DRAFT_488688 [Suillus fuscotomentosus]KAG1898134.1 hypothetical protein F5891DRAFT_488688 [Suillus fuscotomentosus]